MSSMLLTPSAALKASKIMNRARVRAKTTIKNKVQRISYSDIKPKKWTVRRKVEPVSVSVKRRFDNATQSRIKGEQDTSEFMLHMIMNLV
jgi:hypothetical protein